MTHEPDTRSHVRWFFEEAATVGAASSSGARRSDVRGVFHRDSESPGHLPDLWHPDDRFIRGTE